VLPAGGRPQGRGPGGVRAHRDPGPGEPPRAADPVREKTQVTGAGARVAHPRAVAGVPAPRLPGPSAFRTLSPAPPHPITPSQPPRWTVVRTRQLPGRHQPDFVGGPAMRPYLPWTFAVLSVLGAAPAPAQQPKEIAGLMPAKTLFYAELRQPGELAREVD